MESEFLRTVDEYETGLDENLTGNRGSIRRTLALGSSDRDLRLIMTSNFLGSFGDGLYSYLLPLYLTDALKASPAQVGISYGVVNLLAASTLLLGGVLADRYDRRIAMISGWCAWFFAPIVFAFAENWVEALPGMAAWGFWLGGPATTAYVVGSADKRRLTSAFSSVSAAWNLGYVLSPALGGYLASTSGMRVVFFLSSGLYASAGLTLLFLKGQRAIVTPQDSPRATHSLLQLLKTRKLVMFSALFASVIFTLMMFRPFIPKFLADVQGFTALEIGIFGSVLFFGSAILGVLLGKIGDRWQRSYALAAALLLSSFSLVLLQITRDFRTTLIVSLLAGCSYVPWPLLNAIVGPLAPESARARWVSIPQTIGMLTAFIAPYIGGILYDSSPQYPFIVATVVMLHLALLTFTKLPKE